MLLPPAMNWESPQDGFHDWSGLQTADLIAHCALHHLGRTLSLPGSNPEKAEAFERHLMPRLERNSTGNLVGWMVW